MFLMTRLALVPPYQLAILYLLAVLYLCVRSVYLQQFPFHLH